MKTNEFMRKSLIFGTEYNYFDTVKIKNMNQAAAYMENGVYPVDIKVYRDDENKSKRMIAYFFNKDESKEVFEKWCNYDL